MLKKIISTSDIHLGHGRVPVDHMVRNLKAYIFPELKDTDLFIIAGDFWHALQKLDDISSQLVISFICDLIYLSELYHFKIRILRGTYTHDRDQCVLFETLSKNHNIDLKYITEMQLEYMEEEDLKFLYIPDNLPYKDSDECLFEIKQMLNKVQWKQIDFVIGHGYFRHVLPPGIPKEPHCTFRAEQFKDIVKHYVLMGHVHTPSKHKNIYYHGSFDRTAHGEEEPKGFLKLTKNDKYWNVEFVENEDAMKFITVSPIGETIDDLTSSMVKLVEKKFGNTPTGFLRISHPSTETRQLLIHQCRIIFNNDLIVSGIAPKSDTEVKSMIKNYIPQVHEQIIPTMENLPELIFNHIQNHKGQCTLSISEIKEYIVQF